MTKKFLLILLAAILAACSSATGTPEPTPAVPTPEVEEAPVPTLPLPTPTSESPAGRPEGTSLSTDIVGPPMSGCTLQTALRPPDATEESLFPAVNSADWRIGPENASTTIVEYGDFQCPYCGQLEPVLQQLRADYPDDIRLVFRHFPIISIHEKAALAAIAAEAAGRQDRFWDMHDLLYARQNEWVPLDMASFQGWLVDRALELGLDADRFSDDLADPELATLAQDAFNTAVETGIPGTPFLLINGRIYNGPTDYDNLSIVIRLFALESRQYTSCPTMIIDPARQYTATIVMPAGKIVLELFPADSPLAVNNFVFLALEGFYDGVTFHRVFPGYIAQAGDPSGTGFGGPGYAFTHEKNGLSFDETGLLAMESEANGSQFFITYTPLPSLDDGNYTIFGRVVAGLDVLQGLTPRDPSQGINLPPGDMIVTILIEEN